MHVPGSRCVDLGISTYPNVYHNSLFLHSSLMNATIFVDFAYARSSTPCARHPRDRMTCVPGPDNPATPGPLRRRLTRIGA